MRSKEDVCRPLVGPELDLNLFEPFLTCKGPNTCRAEREIFKGHIQNKPICEV